MVEMNGEAITAGSNPIFSAKMGREQPTSLAHSTVPTRVQHTTSATHGVTAGLFIRMRSTSIILTKLAAARQMPQHRDTRNSFHNTRIRSEKRTSPRDNARITAVEAWVPLLPPVPESMGMKAVRTAQADRAFSKCVRMIPVKVAESIKTNSQGVRAFQVSNTPVFS